MQRRALVTGAAAIGLASSGWARAPAKPRIAYLSGRSLATDAHLLEAFREGLKEAGFVDGQDVALEVRWADGRYDEVPPIAKEMAASRPDLIVAVGGNPVSVAFKQVTQTIPIVFGAGADPVTLGLVSNLNRPDGNLTGITLWAQDLDAKRIELARDMLPSAKRMALLMNPANPVAEKELVLSRQAADKLGFSLEVLQANGSSQIERAFEELPPGKVDAIAVAADAFLINRRARIVALAAERRLPAIYPSREFALDGGLVSYGARWSDMYRIIGTYAGRILKGAKPAELPVQRPNTFEMVLNLGTAKALGLTLPPLILNRADEVLE